MPWLILLRKVPREFWYLLAVVALFAVLRWHWIGVGVERCEDRYKKAEAAALVEAQKQEASAPVIAQEAQEAVKPQVIERIKVIRESIPSNISCPDYDDRVQQAIREAATAAD